MEDDSYTDGAAQNCRAIHEIMNPGRRRLCPNSGFGVKRLVEGFAVFRRSRGFDKVLEVHQVEADAERSCRALQASSGSEAPPSYLRPPIPPDDDVLDPSDET